MKIRQISCWLALVFVLAEGAANAATRSSANYSLAAEVFDAGGGRSQSLNYGLSSSITSEPAQTASSANYFLAAGYFSQFGGSPGSVMPTSLATAGSKEGRSPEVEQANAKSQPSLSNSIAADPDGSTGRAGAVDGPSAALVLSIAAQGSGSVRLTAEVPDGRSYQLEAIDDLVVRNWTPLGAAKTAGPDQRVEWLLSGEPDAKVRFFRIRSAPEDAVASK